MEFKAKKIKVTTDNPFKNDKLNRKKEIENLSNLLQNISSPMVLSVNAPWGSGKTTFIEMLHHYLISQKEISIYFNAWESDFAKDPLLAFLGEMDTAITTWTDGNSEKTIAWDKAKKAGVHILKKGIPALIKIGTAGIIDTEAIIEEETSKLLEGFSNDLIEEYSKNKKSIEQFKENLLKVISKDGDETAKLFIFVDELDRCRPTYAIELLERIKHLFHIEGLVIILSLDKEQLAHSVKSLYGAEFEAVGYLRRFIDIEYKLQRPNLDEFIDSHFQNFNINSFFQSRLKYDAFRSDQENMFKTFKFLVNKKKLSLREVEQLLAKLNLVVLATKENTYIYPVLLSFLLITSEFYPSIYINYLEKNTSPKEMIDCLYSLTEPEERYTSVECALIEGFLIAAKTNNHENRIGDTLDVHEVIFKNESMTKVAKRYSEKVIAIAKQPIEWGFDISLSAIAKRINLLEKFYFDNTKS